MTADSKTIATMKRRIALFVVGMFCVVLMASVSGNHNEKPLRPNETVDLGIEPHARIAAFKKGGAQKKIANRGYDIDEVIDQARSLIGTPHLMGGYSARGIDCSGLIKLAHAQADVELPRSSHDQARYGTIVLPGQELQRGDLVFFHSTYKKANLVTHTGIYLGNNEFIHTSSRRGVTVSKLNSDYYRKHYLFATRLGS